MTSLSESPATNSRHSNLPTSATIMKDLENETWTQMLIHDPIFIIEERKKRKNKKELRDTRNTEEENNPRPLL
jgi:hypothetical protein